MITKKEENGCGNGGGGDVPCPRDHPLILSFDYCIDVNQPTLLFSNMGQDGRVKGHCITGA